MTTTTAEFVERARSILTGKTNAELEQLLYSIARGRQEATDLIPELMRGLETGCPEKRRIVVTFLLEHSAIGVYHSEGDRPPAPSKKKKRTPKTSVRFSHIGEIGDREDGGHLEVLSITRCAHCNKSSAAQPLSKCGQCENCYYCSRTCQKRDWSLHKTSCVKIY